MNVLKKIIYLFPFIAVITFSFYLFAPVLAKTLNSDHAVHILMSNHVFLPGDLYYWGQDRLGSLLPILTNLFLKIVPVSSIYGITIVEFILLTLSFYFLQTFLKNYISKLILCGLLFIPFPSMTPQLYIGHPYVSQFFIISLILFLTKFYFNFPSDKKSKKLTTWAIICFFMLLTVWISDLSLIFVLVFVIGIFLNGFIIFRLKGMNRDNFKASLKNMFLHLSILFLIFIPGMKGIFTLKSNCYQQPGYNELVNFKTFRKAYSGVYHFFTRSFTFKIDDVNVSVYHLVLLVVSLIIILVMMKKIKDKKTVFNFYYFIFIMTFFLGYVATLLSKWAYLNGYGARYFIFCYLFLMFFIIFYLDTLPKKIIVALQAFMVIGIISYSIRTYEVQAITCLENGTNHSLKEIRDIKQFQDAGIIADYWFSYICCIDSKMNVVATPHENAYVRNPALIDSVYNRKKILLIKNLWLDTFPDTLKQFNRKFVRNGDQQSLHNFNFCEYRALK